MRYGGPPLWRSGFHRRRLLFVASLAIALFTAKSFPFHASIWGIKSSYPRAKSFRAFDKSITGTSSCLFVAAGDGRAGPEETPRESRSKKFTSSSESSVTRGRRRSRTTERGDYVSNENQQQALLLEDSAIDSFLRGEYAHPFAEDAPAPHPGFSPAKAVDAALRTLRNLDEPHPSHGAAVFQRFLAPLSRSERWGGGTTADPWKEILRGSLTPTMLARRIRASPQFHDLLDWERLDVTEGLSIPTTRADLGVPTAVAFVSAAMFFKDGEEPSIIQFTLRKIGGVWFIDTALKCKREWFMDEGGEDAD